MCGIAGIFGPDAAHYQQAVERMLAAMVHRGPNGQGLFISPSGRCVLGHRRLAILDLSDAAAQPMSTPDGRYHLIYNGEIYNFQDLRSELEKQGDSFRSTGDTEVLLKLLARHGEAALPRCNGMFALAFWDNQTQTLFLARDRFGQKPLYYTRQNNHFIFASELRALLAGGLVSRRVDPMGLAGYLSYGAVPEPRTLLRDVFIVPKASCLHVHDQPPPSTSRFWRPPNDKSPITHEDLRSQFIAAVRRHMVSDVPLGIFLSGGIDSSAVAVTAAKLGIPSLHTISVIFPDQASHSEATFARAIADRIASNHREIPVTGSDLLNLLHQSLDAMDQPSYDALNTYLAAYGARQAGLTVALSGLGGDELFGGYTSFRDIPRMIAWPKALSLPSFLCRAMIQRICPWKARPVKFTEFLACSGDLLNLYLTRRRVFVPWQIRKLLPVTDPDVEPGLIPDRRSVLADLIAERAIPDAVGVLEMETYMADMLLRDSDVMGLAHSLEIRLPFLDADFAEAALRLEPNARIPGDVPKHRFVKAMGDWLPTANTHRPKQGFELPMDAWLTCELRDEVEDAFQRLARSPQSLLNGRVVLALWKVYCRQPDKIRWGRPWSLFVLTRFMQTHKLSMD